MSNEKTRAAIMGLVDGFKFVCAEHGNNCDPHLTSDDLKSFVAHLEGERDKWRMALESLAPMGSEFVNDLDRCLIYIIEQRGIEHRRAVDTVRDRKRVEAENVELKAKVEAYEAMMTAAVSMQFQEAWLEAFNALRGEGE